MALTRQDCLELVREIEELLREYDPGSLDLVLRATERYDIPNGIWLSSWQLLDAFTLNVREECMGRSWTA